MSAKALAMIDAVFSGRRRWAIIHGDTTKLLPLIKKRADVIISDPPYHARAMKNARTNGETMKQRRDGKVYDFKYAAMTAPLRKASSKQFARLVKRWCCVWTDIESDHLWRYDLEPHGLEYIRTGIWHRTNSAPQFSGDRPAQGVEACVIMHPKGRKHWNGGGKSAHWSHTIVNSQAAERVHTTPKPLPLMLEQVQDFSDEDEVVLDPFAGSGTTGVACVRLGRRFIGIERDKTYAALAAERCHAEQRCLSLTDARVGQTSIFDFMESA